MADDAFSAAQIKQLRTIFREELADAGLRLDDAEHQDEARRDFMFLRGLRRTLNGMAAKIGWAIIMALLGALFFLVNTGLSAWKAH